uniref:Uncharacterized protein n=1 Tax=Ralstonia solanacearum TaxID=305 RepID=A0A0S4TW80_RALSL|nr:protein of unknown function [Ralstonia solanacearum]
MPQLAATAPLDSQLASSGLTSTCALALYFVGVVPCSHGFGRCVSGRLDRLNPHLEAVSEATSVRTAEWGRFLPGVAISRFAEHGRALPDPKRPLLHRLPTHPEAVGG